MISYKNAGWIICIMATIMSLVLTGHAKIVATIGALVVCGYALMHVLAYAYFVVLMFQMLLWIFTGMITHDWRWQNWRRA